MKKYAARLSISLPAALNARARKVAKEEMRSFSGLIALALTRYMETRKDEKH